nr:hypothetical protein CFP56_43827 [Quercus suber]
MKFLQVGYESRLIGLSKHAHPSSSGFRPSRYSANSWLSDTGSTEHQPDTGPHQRFRVNFDMISQMDVALHLVQLGDIEADRQMSGILADRMDWIERGLRKVFMVFVATSLLVGCLGWLFYRRKS